MPNQYFAQNRKVGDGVRTVWNFSFAGSVNGDEPYLDDSNVKAALVTYDPDGIEVRTPLTVTLTGPAQVQITPAVPNGADFVIYRETENEVPVADFTDFASISEDDLDRSFRQTLFTVQEALDDVTDSVEATADVVARSNLALDTSNTALSTADDAFAVAGAAETKADAAVVTANAADAAAAAAVATANAAEDTANAADAKADTAIADTTTFQADLDALEANVDALLGSGAADDLMYTTDNLAGLANYPVARSNLDVYSSAEADAAAGTAAANAITAHRAAVDPHTGYVRKIRNVNSGSWLEGGGDLQSDRTLRVEIDNNSWLLDDEGNQRLFFRGAGSSSAGTIFRNHAPLSAGWHFQDQHGDTVASIAHNGGATFTADVVNNDGGFLAQTRSGRWFEARVSDNSNSGVFRVQKADGTSVLVFNTVGFGGGDPYVTFGPGQLRQGSAPLVDQSRQINSGSGLTGGGNLSSNRTLAIATNGVTQTHLADNSVSQAQLQGNSVGSVQLQPGAVGPSHLQDNSVFAGHLGTGSDIRDWVAARFADVGTDAVGSLIFAINVFSDTRNWGGTISGAGLRPYGTTDLTSSQGASNPSGTWQCLGHSRGTTAGSTATLWKRIS